ncbi:hypothetical protein K1T71_013920 [Dendrolimus kikuchii]|uniref:Uncharacterized protein n=1 Tax=Dendrolimus kikuchii TaxID=765133 RepID=A0ACC1CG45_9NEOP|nr:hypothetical protein K1T71_013920 [Dendrolimus kikuchii]
MLKSKNLYLVLFLVHNTKGFNTAIHSSLSENDESDVPGVPKGLAHSGSYESGPSKKLNLEETDLEPPKRAKATSSSIKSKMKPTSKTKTLKNKYSDSDDWESILSSVSDGDYQNIQDSNMDDIMQMFSGLSLIKHGYLKIPKNQLKRIDDDSEKVKRFLSEVNAGDQAELFGSNPHYKQSHKYGDLSRRFVPQYPYTDKQKDDPLTPKLAPPEVVLAAAKESALLEASKPINPTDDLIRKDILRTGQYWNSVWKEDMDPSTILRNKKKKNLMQLGSIRAQISPGTKLYDLISKLKNISPRLLYVINIKDDKQSDF